MSDPRPPATLQQQADLIEYLIRRMHMRDGQPAKEAWMLLTAAELEDLKGIEARLRRMAPFENQIRKMVTAR